MKTTFSLRRKLDSLRKKYPRFVYQKYFYRVKRGDLKITFYFKIEPDIVLKPRIIIKNIPEGRMEKIGKRVMNNLVFHLGMMEIPSYWKTTCSPEIAIQAGYLDKNQLAWWHTLIIKGMGQYFYQNKIDWRDQDFLKISVNLGVAAPVLETTSLELKDRYLVPLAGGKDSLVTLEALKKRGESINCFLLNPTKIIKKVVKIAGVKNPVIVERRIDPTLLDLNKQGYLNGHTPFTALLSFTSVLCATLFDYQHIAFSNEKSANEGNVLYLGKNINHQWAKTSEFEKMFRVYCQKYLVKSANYFSYLRKYTELQIAKMFSQYRKYFAFFSSCNAGMKIRAGAKDRWCSQCPKCLFTYLILYPFLTKKDLHKIFGQDLFENKKLLPVLKNMVGQGRHKPFECVGTYQETNEALRLSLAKAKKKEAGASLIFCKNTVKLSELRDKKILILGFGREGQDTFKFLKQLFPKKKICIADQKLDKNYLKKLGGYDVIVKTPGIPFKILPKSSLDKIITQTDIFFDNCPGKIIGVTGTKGKSTTASFIYQTLKKAGLKVHLVGNIGQPVLAFLNEAEPQSIFVYELSAHQLYGLKKSPKIAILLNIYPEHLDYYRSFREYANAKANIAKYQTKDDYLIYNSQDKEVSKIARKVKARKIPIRGKYYELDMAAAKAVAKIFKVPELKKFEFLPHRLEFVGRFKGVSFYNDSLSTIPQTTIEALDFLGNKVQTLILGGFDRGLDFKKLAQRIKKSKVKTLILFPTTGQRIWQEVSKAKPPSIASKTLDISGGVPPVIEHFFVKDMATAVKLAYQHTDKDNICLMSPASPSFGIFKDYAERGEMFKKFVKNYR